MLGLDHCESGIRQCFHNGQPDKRLILGYQDSLMFYMHHIVKRPRGAHSSRNRAPSGNTVAERVRNTALSPMGARDHATWFVPQAPSQEI